MAAPGRDAAITAVVVVLTACAFAAAGDHRTLAGIQRLDDAWLRLMISGRVTPLTAIAKVFNVAGHEYVTLPVRIAIAGLLASGAGGGWPGPAAADRPATRRSRTTSWRPRART